MSNHININTYMNAIRTVYSDIINNDKPSFETQYADAFKNILINGVYKENRTGISTIAIQHQYICMPNIAENFPILRGKKVFPKMALKELVWMLLGRTDIKWLHDRKVTYWDEWVLEDGTIGRSYGYQYRNFNGIDQIKELINSMGNDPLGRRHIVSLWNANDLDKMALPPCMYDYHFSCVPTVKDNEYTVDLHAHLRSNDSFLGAPYDFMFCGFFVILMCDFLNRTTNNHYIAGTVHYTADDYHLYENHLNQVQQYLSNVTENMNNCVTTPSICHWNLSDNESIMKQMNADIFDIDVYLNYLADHMDEVKVQYQTDPGFKYDTIKADIAV